MTLPVGADIPLILSRIRPNADWGWKGEAPNIPGEILNEPSNIVWRDLVQVEPTEVEMSAELTVIEAELVQEDVIRQGVKSRANAVAGINSDVLTLPEIRGIIEALAFSMGGIDDTGKIRPIDEWNIDLF